MPRCASCKLNTVRIHATFRWPRQTLTLSAQVQHIDCRGVLVLSYARPIDRCRTAQSVCTFCGVFHKMQVRSSHSSLSWCTRSLPRQSKDIIYPCCEHCRKQRNPVAKKPRCHLCKERSSYAKYLPLLIQHHHRGRAVINTVCTSCVDGIDTSKTWHAADLERIMSARRKK